MSRGRNTWYTWVVTGRGGAVKVGDAVELMESDGDSITGTVVAITVYVETEDGEEYEIPVDEAIVPELEGTEANAAE